MIKVLCLSLLFPVCAPAGAFSDETEKETIFSRPGRLTFITNQLGDLKDFWNVTVQKKNAGSIAAMAAGMGLLIAADQAIYEEMWRWGHRTKI